MARAFACQQPGDCTDDRAGVAGDTYAVAQPVTVQRTESGAAAH